MSTAPPDGAHCGPLQDVSIGALLVSSKLEDTLKKLRDIQIAAYAVRSIMDGGSGTAEPDTQVC